MSNIFCYRLMDVYLRIPDQTIHQPLSLETCLHYVGGLDIFNVYIVWVAEIDFPLEFTEYIYNWELYVLEVFRFVFVLGYFLT